MHTSDVPEDTGQAPNLTWAATVIPLQQNRDLNPSFQVSEQESAFFFYFYLRALLSTAEWLGWGRCASRTFHSAGGGLSITRCVTPFYRAGGGGGDAPSGKRKRVRRRRRRRCSLSSSAETFSACCREHGPRERTGAATIALPLDGLEAHLAKSIFSVMPAVYFVLNGY